MRHARLENFGGHIHTRLVHFQQRVVRSGLGERPGVTTSRDHLRQRQLAEEFERRQIDPRSECREHLQQVREFRDADNQHYLRRRHARQTNVRFDDDAERSFGTDEQMAEVVTGVVLDESAIQFQYFPRARDDL